MLLFEETDLNYVVQAASYFKFEIVNIEQVAVKNRKHPPPSSRLGSDECVSTRVGCSAIALHGNSHRIEMWKFFNLLLSFSIVII